MCMCCMLCQTAESKVYMYVTGMLDQGVKVLADEPDGGAPVNDNFQQHPSMSDMLICYPTLQGEDSVLTASTVYDT